KTLWQRRDTHAQSQAWELLFRSLPFDSTNLLCHGEDDATDFASADNDEGVHIPPCAALSSAIPPQEIAHHASCRHDCRNHHQPRRPPTRSPTPLRRF